MLTVVVRGDSGPGCVVLEVTVSTVALRRTEEKLEHSEQSCGLICHADSRAPSGCCSEKTWGFWGRHGSRETS